MCCTCSTSIMYCIGRREKNRLSVGQITRGRERSIAMRNFKAFFFFNKHLSFFYSHIRVLRLSFSRLAGGPGRARVDGLFSESVDAAHTCMDTSVASSPFRYPSSIECCRRENSIIKLFVVHPKHNNTTLYIPITYVCMYIL